jgi:phosphoribosyl 1,2-cyclic phosphate phosphodiesterase
MKYKITFLGTGTSQGIPVIGCECKVCMSPDFRDKRLRTSVHIQSHEASVVIDTGPDFRYQCLKNKINTLDAVIFTHEHMDHIAGLDDIRPFNFFNRDILNIWAEPRVQQAIKRIYHYAFEEDKYPGVPDLHLNTITENIPFYVKDMEIFPFRVMHKSLPVLGFKIGSLCYITDANFISEEVMKNIKNCQILVINSLRKEKHISHFNLEEALEVIKEVNPGMAFLTHISHQLGTYEELISQLPENIRPAYDGLQILF